jgi:hypothetical protein
MNIVALSLFPLGMFLFVSLAQRMRPAYSFPDIVVDPHAVGRAILVVLGIVFVPLLLSGLILVFHEWCHGLAFQWAGAKPQYGAKLVRRICPVLYATSPGNWLTKRQYLVVALAPTVLVNCVGIALMWFPTLLRYLLIFPLTVHFCGCVGDWWMTFFILRLPANTMIEDAKEGFRYRLDQR